MKYMINLYICMIAVAILAPSQTVRAAEDMGPLICAIQQTIDCRFQQECLSGVAQYLNLPVLFSIEFKEMIIRAHLSDGTNRVTKIDHLKLLEDQIVLSGFDKRAWNLTVYKSDYRFSGNAIEPDSVLGIFGACTIK